MEICDLPTSSIVPYPKNNRIHSDSQIQLISDSIKQFGFNQPLVLDEKNVVLVGHGRLYAAQKLGLEKVPCWIVSGLTATQKKAYRILDNKLQNDSTWDFASLKEELQDLEDEEFDLKRWGLEQLLTPEFDPILADDQSNLDEAAIKLVKCPSCEHIFDSRKHEVKD